LIIVLNLLCAILATRLKDVDGAMIFKCVEMLVPLTVSTLTLAQLHQLLLHHQRLKKRNADSTEQLLSEECFSLLELQSLSLELIFSIDGEQEENSITENSSNQVNAVISYMFYSYFY